MLFFLGFWPHLVLQLHVYVVLSVDKFVVLCSLFFERCIFSCDIDQSSHQLRQENVVEVLGSLFRGAKLTLVCA